MLSNQVSRSPLLTIGPTMIPPLLAQINPPALTTNPPTPQADPDAWKAEALQEFWGLDFKSLDREEWIYVGTYYGLRVMFVLVLMILAWTISSWASSVVGTGLRRVKFDETLTRFISKLVRWVILLLVGLMCLSYFGVETTSFAAVISAAGLAVGLAFQGTLSNFAAGAMLLIFRPYKVGDVVNVAGNLGKVFEIELFTTAIDTFDNRRFIIPNSEIFGATIENITYHPKRRVEVEVGTSYEADIDQTRHVLEQAIATVDLCVGDPEPAVVLTGLGASSVDWSVRGWAHRDDFGDAKQALIRAVKVELDRAGIEIPYPHLDVQLNQPA
ncbi:MAG: mechanosensitive ion channel family protein [Bythopirellula sp.]